MCEESPLCLSETATHCVFVLSASGYILTYLLTCVQAALTYAEAQMRIDDQSMNDDVTLGLRRLNDLAKILKQRRQQNGFVDG